MEGYAVSLKETIASRGLARSRAVRKLARNVESHRTIAGTQTTVGTWAQPARRPVMRQPDLTFTIDINGDTFSNLDTDATKDYVIVYKNGTPPAEATGKANPTPPNELWIPKSYLRRVGWFCFHR